MGGGGVNDQIMPRGEGSFTNTFSSNLNTYLFVFEVRDPHYAILLF